MSSQDPAVRLDMNNNNEQVVIVDYSSNTHGVSARNLQSALIVMDKFNNKRWLIEVSIGTDAKHSLTAKLSVWENGCGWTDWLSLVPGDSRLESIFSQHGNTINSNNQMAILDATVLLLIEAVRRARTVYSSKL